MTKKSLPIHDLDSEVSDPRDRARWPRPPFITIRISVLVESVLSFQFPILTSDCLYGMIGSAEHSSRRLLCVVRGNVRREILESST